MATTSASGVMGGGDHQTTKPGLQDDHDQQLIRRSSGRRKAKSGGDSKKHKQPRRGMGVAKLERLRLQEQDMTETDEAGFRPLPVLEMNAHLYADFGHMGSTRNPVGFSRFYGLSGSDHHRLLQYHEPDFSGKNGTHDAIAGNVVKCSYLHCDVCHKKKKSNGDRRFLGLDLGDNYDLGAKAPQTLGNYGNKVEVVAVHRKGSSSSSHGGNGGVLMEYNFFPSANIGGGGGGGGGDGEESGVFGNSARSGFNGSKCVDLSLKLSSY